MSQCDEVETRIASNSLPFCSCVEILHLITSRKIDDRSANCILTMTMALQLTLPVPFATRALLIMFCALNAATLSSWREYQGVNAVASKLCRKHWLCRTP